MGHQGAERASPGWLEGSIDELSHSGRNKGHWLPVSQSPSPTSWDAPRTDDFTVDFCLCQHKPLERSQEQLWELLILPVHVNFLFPLFASLPSWREELSTFSFLFVFLIRRCAEVSGGSSRKGYICKSGRYQNSNIKMEWCRECNCYFKKKRRKKKKSVSVSLNIHQIRIGRVPSPCTLMENFLVWILNKMKYSVNLNFFEAWERSQIDPRGIGTPNVSISEDTYYQRSQC